MHCKSLSKRRWNYSKQQDIIIPLGVDETVEWFNSFVPVPKSSGMVRLCLDLARLDEKVIRLMHRVPILNDILQKLNNA